MGFGVVVTKGNADFKSDAVKVAREKRIPQHEKRPVLEGMPYSNQENLKLHNFSVTHNEIYLNVSNYKI